MKPVIEMRDVTKVYRMGDHEIHALRGITHTINEGEMVAIMGPSGSGKSTLLNILGCLDKPSGGEFLLDGIDVIKLSDNRLAELRNKKIGFVFQSFNLLKRVSALDNVAMPMMYGDDHNAKKRAANALVRVGLEARKGHKPNQLSGGEQQRVAIARSLINNPSLVLADEPTGNLDSKSSSEIMGLLADLNEHGMTIIVVTHERDIAEFCERIIFIRDGLIERQEIIPHRRKIESATVSST